jgi:hypothetical protein
MQIRQVFRRQHYNFVTGPGAIGRRGTQEGSGLMQKSVRFILLLPFLALVTCLWGTQDSAKAPDFPGLSLDGVSGPIRDQIQKAYNNAMAHPKKAQASGALGMTLQTYGLAEEAKKYYRYAAELEPSEFRWT